jgi:hypothetical protein
MNLPIVTALKQTSSPRQITRLTAVLSTTALVIVAASVLTLTGCSTDKDLKPIEHKPSKLPTLTAPSQTLALVWKDSIGSEEKLDPLRPQLDVRDGKSTRSTKGPAV